MTDEELQHIRQELDRIDRRNKADARLSKILGSISISIAMMLAVLAWHYLAR